MGTRNLTCILIDGEYKVAQYGQWDGYPGGGGIDILTVLRDGDIEKLKENARRCTYLNEDQIQARWVAAGAKEGEGWVDSDVSKKMGEQYPQFQRDMGYGVVQFIMESTDAMIHMQDNITFAGDGLFCEWAYVVDLDKGLLEVFKGFGKQKHTGQRFSKFNKDDEEYAAVGFAASYKLDDLPSDKEFLNDLEPQEEDEE